jgi:hypothetical protein
MASDGMVLGLVTRLSENVAYAVDARDRHIALAFTQGVPLAMIAKAASLSEDETQRIISVFVIGDEG